jgi:hypothetical protein
VNLEAGIEDLVERTRLGEQNAGAQLDVLGEQYRRGRAFVESQGGSWEQVVRSFKAAERYVMTHPCDADAGCDVMAAPESRRIGTGVDWEGSRQLIGTPIKRRLARRRAARGEPLEPRSLGMSPDPNRQPQVPEELPPPVLAILRQMAIFGAEPTPQGAQRAGAMLCGLPEVAPGSVGEDALLCAVVLLAAGPVISSRRVADAAEAVSDRGAWEKFLRGANMPGTVVLRSEPSTTPSFGWERHRDWDVPQDPYTFAGSAYGRAARLQMVRRGAHPGILDPGLAWELGQ